MYSIKSQQLTSKQNSRASILFVDCLPSFVSISDQIYIEKNKLMTSNDFVHGQEFKIVFTTSGDVESYIICQVDLESRKLDSKKIEYIRSLFIESMNIFMNQYIDSLENSSEHLILLNSPKIFSGNNKQQVIQQINEHQGKVINFSYEYMMNMKELTIPIQLYFHFQPAHISEV